VVITVEPDRLNRRRNLGLTESSRGDQFDPSAARPRPHDMIDSERS